MKFGERLRRLRKEKGLTQKQLADLIGVQNRVISFYEVGDRMPSPEVLRKLSAALHVSADFLLGTRNGETVDVTGLNEEDRRLVRMLIEALQKKNQK